MQKQNKTEKESGILQLYEQRLFHFNLWYIKKKKKKKLIQFIERIWPDLFLVSYMSQIESLWM